jgi:hypothetical protein
VFADAIGGSGTATGYFLIYVETDTLKAIQEAFLPDAETDGQYLSTKTVKVRGSLCCDVSSASDCVCVRVTDNAIQLTRRTRSRPTTSSSWRRWRSTTRARRMTR